MPFTVAQCGDYIDEYIRVPVHNILHNIIAQYYFNEASVEHLLRYCNSKTTFLKPQEQQMLNADFRIGNYYRIELYFCWLYVILVSTAECNYG